MELQEKRGASPFLFLETMCQELGIKHIYTKPYRPQTNGKIEAFFKIAKNEFFYPNRFESENNGTQPFYTVDLNLRF